MSDDLMAAKPMGVISLAPLPKQPSQANNRLTKVCILFATYSPVTRTICLPNLTDTALKLSELASAHRRMTLLTHAIATLLDQVADECDYTLQEIFWPQNMAVVFRGLLSDVQHNYNYITTVKDEKQRDRFNILALVPLLPPAHKDTSLTTIWEAELLLGECNKNLTKVDTAARINTDILPTIGLPNCTNLVLLCHLLQEVQAHNNKNHPVLYYVKPPFTWQNPQSTDRPHVI